MPINMKETIFNLEKIKVELALEHLDSEAAALEVAIEKLKRYKEEEDKCASCKYRFDYYMQKKMELGMTGL